MNPYFSCTILALNDSARSEYIYRSEKMAEGILEYMLGCVELPREAVRVVSNCDSVLKAASGLGLTAEPVERGRRLSPVDDSFGSGLILMPHHGPISPSRVRRIIDEREKHPKARLVSAMRVPVNCNPVWLSGVPKENVSGNVAVIDDFKADLSVVLSKETRRKLGLNGDKVLGSQWLPDLYALDGAIVFIPEGCDNRSEVYPVRDSLEEYEDMPLLYRLPFIQLHEDSVPDCDLENWPQKILFGTLNDAGREGI